MQLQRCDRCCAEAPSTGHISAGSWINGKGSDRWVKLGFTVFRETRAPAHVELREGQAFYAQVFSQIDLCSKCLDRILETLGEAPARKISLDAAEQGDYVTLPREALEALKAGAAK